MYSEIGSEFWSVPLTDRQNTLFDGSEKWFISGTAALGYILDDILSRKKLRSAGVPSWCCSSMIEPFLERSIEVHFYSVTVRGNTLSVDFDLPDTDVLLMIDYFGYSAHIRVPDGYPGVVIRDETHSIFSSRTSDADYRFGSLRKWAGFWTGGFAHSTKWNADRPIPPVSDEYVGQRRSAMLDKKKYIDGCTDSKDYLRTFSECEDFLDSCGVMGADARDVECAGLLDLDTVKSKRRNNAQLLIGELQDYVLFRELSADSCPLFVPIIVPGDHRDRLRQHLTGHSIYCPIHWGLSPLHRLNTAERYIYEHEISLVCDQRYDAEDMERILSVFRSFR